MGLLEHVDSKYERLDEQTFLRKLETQTGKDTAITTDEETMNKILTLKQKKEKSLKSSQNEGIS